MGKRGPVRKSVDGMAVVKWIDENLDEFPEEGSKCATECSKLISEVTGATRATARVVLRVMRDRPDLGDMIRSGDLSPWGARDRMSGVKKEEGPSFLLELLNEFT